MKKIYLFTLLGMIFSCKPLTRPDYYSQTNYWKKYQSFLPANLWYSDSQLPAETYWNWRDFSIHIDRMPNENAAVKIIILHGAGGNGRIVGLLGNFIHALGYEYLAPDLIGYGLTKNAKEKNISYAVLGFKVKDECYQMKAISRSTDVLCGLRMGGLWA